MSPSNALSGSRLIGDLPERQIQRTLDPFIMVRIHISQHLEPEPRYPHSEAKMVQKFILRPIFLASQRT